VRRIDPPARGRWPGGSPASIVLGRAVFERARWRQRIPGVSAQYREARARDSRHLCVVGAEYVITHADAHNPDGPDGAPLSHALVDTRTGRALVSLGVLALAWRYLRARR